MTSHTTHRPSAPTTKPVQELPARLLLYLSLGALGLYILIEHRAHLLGVLPYLIFLACPLMHLFMHGGHGGHDHQHQGEDQKRGDTPSGKES